MLEKGIKKRFGERIFFATYILSEMKKKRKDRKFKEYLDTLPHSCNENPGMFTDEELSYLEGSKVKDHIIERKDYVKK